MKNLKEGKIKSNIKLPPLDCNNCGYYGSGYEFQFGMLWWANEHCPICESKDLKLSPKRGNPPPPPKPKKNHEQDN